MSNELQDYLRGVQVQLSQALRDYMEELDTPQPLKDAMSYSLLAGGKRIRPAFLLATIQALQEDSTKGLPAACAVEMIHTYSLIHDDLPSMDNDDFRRGKLTNHKVYGEAVAILAGDALLTHAFTILSTPLGAVHPATQLKLVQELSYYAGAKGMVGGQILDIQDPQGVLGVEGLSEIHRRKTGDLLTASIRMGAILGNASEKQLSCFTSYAAHIGLAFQIQDDILDVIGDEAKLGKKTGSDEQNAKVTYVTLLGLEGARQQLDEHLRQAKQALQETETEMTMMLQLTNYMVQREH